MEAFSKNGSVDSGAIATPGIRILREADGYRLQQSRPPMGPVLASLTLDQALEQVTMLLPICGAAQRIAARRAVDAARGAAAEASGEVNATLLREQLQSALWRLVVDWPDLVGEPQNLESLRHALRTPDPSALRDALGAQLDGLDRAESPGAVGAWVERGACTAARVVSRALALEAQCPDWPETETLAPGSVIDASRGTGFWPGDDAPLEPPPGEVGTRAMRRHPLVGNRGLPGGLLAGRLLAQALDAAFLVTAEPSAAVTGDDWKAGAKAGPDRRPAGEGIGWAMTARGPLLHRVVLDGVDAVKAKRWDVLAPTDWHFGPHGPVARALGSLDGTMDAERVRFLVAGFDPCAAWSVVEAEGIG